MLFRLQKRPTRRRAFDPYAFTLIDFEASILVSRRACLYMFMVLCEHTGYVGLISN